MVCRRHTARLPSLVTVRAATAPAPPWLCAAPVQVAGYGTHNTYLRQPERTVRVEPQQIEESVDASLKRLGTDYIDLLQVGLKAGDTA